MAFNGNPSAILWNPSQGTGVQQRLARALPKALEAAERRFAAVCGGAAVPILLAMASDKFSASLFLDQVLVCSSLHV